MYDEAVRRTYPFLDAVEAAAADIRAEALALPADLFAPMPGYDAGWRGFVLDAGRWSAEFPGVDFAANRARCPRTWAVVAALPGVELCGVLRLEPGVTIAPHRDPREDDVIRCHLGLRLPEEEQAWWPEGRARLMDVRRTHWARNESAAPRYTMVLDVRMPFVVPADACGEWRPGPGPEGGGPPSR